MFPLFNPPLTSLLMHQVPHSLISSLFRAHIIMQFLKTTDSVTTALMQCQYTASDEFESVQFLQLLREALLL